MKELFESLRNGEMILVHEPSENEISMFVLAEKLTHEKLILLKKYATGDIGVDITFDLARNLGIDFVHNLLEKLKFTNIHKSSAALLYDYKGCETGSSDNDKILIIKELVKTTKDKQYSRFRNNVKVPGHTKFFIAHEGLLNERQGHTELNASLCYMAGVPLVETAIVMCTLRDPKTGKLIRRKDIKKYPELKKLHITSKKEIIDMWDSYE